MFNRKIIYLLFSVLMVVSLVANNINVTAMPAGPTDETKVPHYFGPSPNWANSPLTLPDVRVEISGDGTGAAATATVGANGAVTGVTITNPGQGYTSAAVNFIGSGSGALANAVVNTSGVVTAITINSGGKDYTQPAVYLSGGGATVDATASAYGGVNAVNLISSGSGYTFPTIDFDLPDDPNGTQAKAHVSSIALGDPVDGLDPTTGAITAIVLDSPGSGYAKAPNVIIRDGTIFDPVAHPTGSNFSEATASATLTIQAVSVDTFGSGYTSAPAVSFADLAGSGSGADATALTDFGAVVAINLSAGGSGYTTTGGIRKFVDGLPGLNITGANNLGQYIPIAVPDTTTFPGTDYYVIALVQHREQMHSNLPPTLLREYVQLSTDVVPGNQVALTTDLLGNGSTPALMPDGTQAVGVDQPHFLGPIIVAQKDRAVRITFYNLLPTGSGGDLFLPVDSSMMGSGTGPGSTIMDPMDEGTVMDGVRNPLCTEYPKDSMNCFQDNRATLHLHGGITPWISDGTPHQWITPANENTPWPQGVAVSSVPDMVGGQQPAGVPDCSAANDGCMTFYYTNQQSARLMFYHDHAWGITRLNVYAGEAAGYIIRDNTEQKLIDSGLIPSGADEIPLVIQDRTFVPQASQLYGDPANGVYGQDPTWDQSRWGSYGNLWYHHVYMPAQNPGDPSGMSAYGRWMYGPWFWPPATPVHGPIANPYYNMDPKGPDGIRGTADDWSTPLAKPCNLDDPSTWQYDTDPFCEPQLIPGTPNISAGMEQFNDTPIVNGTAYPTTTVDPKAYRLRILNAANDRFWNLQWYVADPNSTSTDLNGNGDPIGGTEVAFKAAELQAAQTDPNVFPTPDTSLSPVGPSWIQIGSEGGFLPAPVVVPNQPITWITDPTRFDFGNVDKHSLLLAPAERADVIVDFSKYAGKTLILYNDAPAAFPARVASYDYYTGGPDLSPAGAPSTLPGYGPNTRTIMQVKVANTTPATAYNLSALQAAFRHQANGSGVFESGQHPIIVGQAAYNSAYGTSFASSSWCNAPNSTSQRCDGYARISDQGGNLFGFNTLLGQNTKMQIPLEPKAIHDEMNAAAFDEFGRMTANLGLEAVPATPVGQNIILYPYVNPSTELIDATNLPKGDLNVTPISSASDGTQIWKITHNGVDTHPIHFHLYDVQVINRVTWDNIIIPPDPTELGWKDTVRVSPLEDTIVALRPIIPALPWEIPNSIRPLNPMMPLGSTAGFNNVDAQGNPTNPVMNALVNFGWEYVYHCHILSHEEMDMMRPVSVAMPPKAPDGLTWAVSGSGNNTRLTLNWNDNSINETEYVVQQSINGGAWADLATIPSPLDQTNTTGPRSYIDTTFRRNSNTYAYQVVARNTVGYGGQFKSLTVQSVSPVVTVIQAPSNLSAALTGTQAAPTVQLSWTDNATNETGFIVQRSTDGGATFTQTGTAPARSNTGTVTFTDSSVTTGTTYTYRVAAVTGNATSGFSNLVTIAVSVPADPSNLVASAAIRTGNRETVPLSWSDNSNNETGFTIQWSASATFGTIAGTANAGANATTFAVTNLPRQVWYFRIRAYNVVGTSGWATSLPVAAAAMIKAPASSPLIFFNDFSKGLGEWTGEVGNVQANAAASLDGSGGLGLASSWRDDDPEHTSGQPAYVYHQISNQLSSYMSNFAFNPDMALTSDTPVDILTGLDQNGAEIFGVQYLHQASSPDVYQIRGWVKTETVDLYTTWVSINNAAQNIQLDWQSRTTSSLNLYIDGEVVASVTGDTSLYKLVQERLGPSRGVDKISFVNAQNISNTVYLDEFISLSTDVSNPYVVARPLSIFLPLVVSP